MVNLRFTVMLVHECPNHQTFQNFDVVDSQNCSFQAERAFVALVSDRRAPNDNAFRGLAQDAIDECLMY
jgi:hypothetical protein